MEIIENDRHYKRAKVHLRETMMYFKGIKNNVEWELIMFSETKIWEKEVLPREINIHFRLTKIAREQKYI